MAEEQEPAVFDWWDLLLILALWLVIFCTLDLAIQWAALRWSLNWLVESGGRGSLDIGVAGLAAWWISSKITDALGYKPIKRPSKLDSKPPLP